MEKQNQVLDRTAIEALLSRDDASLFELQTAVRSCEQSLTLVNAEISSKRENRREEKTRAMKGASRIELAVLSDDCELLEDLHRRLCDRIEQCVHQADLERARRHGANEVWVAKHKTGLTSRLESIPAVVAKGLEAKTEAVRARWQEYANTLQRIREASGNEALEVASSFLLTYDDILHAETTSLGSARDNFLRGFVAAVKKAV